MCRSHNLMVRSCDTLARVQSGSNASPVTRPSWPAASMPIFCKYWTRFASTWAVAELWTMAQACLTLSSTQCGSTGVAAAADDLYAVDAAPVGSTYSRPGNSSLSVHSSVCVLSALFNHALYSVKPCFQQCQVTLSVMPPDASHSVKSCCLQ